MRVLVISDTHGDISRLGDVLDACSQIGVLDHIIHLGDGARDMDRLAEKIAAEFPRAVVHGVQGNNDFSAPWLPPCLTLSLGRQMLFAAHGHHHGVKQGLSRLDEASAAAGCHVTLFGHTHRPLMQMGHTLLLNPGSVMDGRYLLLTLDEHGRCNPQLRSLRDDLDPDSAVLQ